GNGRPPASTPTPPTLSQVPAPPPETTVPPAPGPPPSGRSLDRWRRSAPPPAPPPPPPTPPRRASAPGRPPRPAPRAPPSRAPAGVGTMVLLTDGTVIGSSNANSTWYKLTPDAAGNYVGGTWSTLAGMSTRRLYTGTNVLPDGRVFVLGGEYSGPSLTNNWTNTGEIYNPLTNAWSPVANFP